METWEAWELKAGIEAILNGVNRPVTLAVLAEALGSTEPAVQNALEEYAADLAAADRGLELRHRAQGVRLEVKPRFAELVGRVIPAWAPKPLSKPALETLVIVALKQPVTLGEINAIRKIESAGTLQTLGNRRLIARATRLGPKRERYWRTTPLFLEIFQLTSLDELRNEQGRLERTFPEVFGVGMGMGEGMGGGEGMGALAAPEPETPSPDQAADEAADLGAGGDRAVAREV
jgi:segregation and condensation protein B